MDIGSLLTQSSPELTDLALLILRAFIGVCFVVHGLGKLGVVGTGTCFEKEGTTKSQQARLSVPREHCVAQSAGKSLLNKHFSKEEKL